MVASRVLTAEERRLLSLVDWPSYSVFGGGSASDMPERLRDLAEAGDEEAADKAYWRLNNHVILQGELSESALRSVPFLLQCLAREDRPSRARIFDLLAEIAFGRATGELSALVDDAGREVHLGDACRTALSQGASTFRKALTESDSRIRRFAADLVIAADPDRDSIEPLFRRLADVEKDEEVADVLLDWADELRHTPGVRTSFRYWQESS